MLYAILAVRDHRDDEQIPPIFKRKGLNFLKGSEHTVLYKEVRDNLKWKEVINDILKGKFPNGTKIISGMNGKLV